MLLRLTEEYTGTPRWIPAFLETGEVLHYFTTITHAVRIMVQVADVYDIPIINKESNALVR